MAATPSPLRPVRFDVPADRGAHQAELVAEFTSWTPLAMDRAGDGSHHLVVLVDAQRSWRYGFVLDGEPDDDGGARLLRPGPPGRSTSAA